jgi:diguanylate cyclase (GGDEF)-like protein
VEDGNQVIRRPAGDVIATVDRLLAGLSRSQVLVASSCLVAAIAVVDYATGYDVSVSIFYLMPVAMAAWYGGRFPNVLLSALACASWFVADILAGHPYNNLAHPLWETLIRFGFFLANGSLLVALRSSLARQSELARTDALTGVFGRRAFEERLGHDLELARRYGGSLTVAFVDVDDFKGLNDTHGHGVGDEALRAVAKVLQAATRRADTVARLGGDEFALALPDTDPEGAREVAAKLKVGLPEALAGVSPGLTCSIGVVTFKDEMPGTEEAVRVADALMYQAKREGKGTVKCGVVGDAGKSP